MKVKEYLLYYDYYKVGIINFKRTIELMGPLKKEQAKNLQDFERIVRTVDQALDDMNERERTFIQLKYFQRQPMSEIEKQMLCSQRTLYRIHRNALERVEKSFTKTLN